MGVQVGGAFGSSSNLGAVASPAAEAPPAAPPGRAASPVLGASPCTQVLPLSFYATAQEGLAPGRVAPPRQRGQERPPPRCCSSPGLADGWPGPLPHLVTATLTRLPQHRTS